jgi:ParB family chromosome partitioning protein
MAAILEQVPQPAQRAMQTAHANYRTAAHAQLVRSALNVRQKENGSLHELAALIASQGLLHNLIGYAQLIDGVPTGIIEIVAGWRRTLAIGELIAAGLLPIDYDILVLLVPQDEAVAISLAENQGRVPMHPADVFDAMLALAARGISAADIAITFGVSELTVRRRLKLANVASRFTALYRADKIALEQMEALALVDDHALQEQAWDSLDQWSRSAYHLRRLLTQQRLDAQHDRVARFVGLKAYRAAGGTVTRDLFSEAQQGYIDDPALLERLASAKLARAAKSLEKEAWQWLEVRVRTDRAELAQFARVRSTRRDPTAEEGAELARLQASVDEAEAALDRLDEDDPACDALDARLEQDRAAHAALVRTLQQPLDSDMALAGALLTLDEAGQATVYRGLIRTDDKARMAQQSAVTDAEGQKDKPVRLHSERLTLALTAHRTAALQAEVAAQPDLALVVLACAMAGEVFGGRALSSVVQVGVRHRFLQQDAPDIESSRAWSVLSAMRDGWQQKLPADASAWFDWLAGQPQQVLRELLAFCTAWSVDTVGSGDAATPMFQRLAKSAKLDMANWWTPSKAGYLDHVSKQRMVDVVTQAVSPMAAQPLLTGKKAAVSSLAETALAETRWLPPELRVE